MSAGGYIGSEDTTPLPARLHPGEVLIGMRDGELYVIGRVVVAGRDEEEAT